MKVSIVTISFNQVEFLERTLLSVLTQTGVDLEYIVCDPGSTDGSRDIIEKYRDKIAHIIYDKDKGPADGLNKGFAKATGDIYCYLNSDDTLEPGALRYAVDYFRSHPKVDVACGHAWVIDRHDKRLRRVWSEPFRRVMVAYGAAVQIQPSTFIRAAAFHKTKGFNIENRSSWDAELMVDLYLTGARIRLMNAFLSTYRLHAVSITNSGKMEAQNIEWGKRRFVMLMGRSWQQRDRHLARLLRYHKHVSAPSHLLERLVRGPIFRRGVT